MAVGLYPGSFDPATFGHLDVIKRASKIVDRLYVAVLVNSEKNALFSAEERCELLRKITKDIPNVEVVSYSGLTVELAREYGATVMFRGLRAVTDFEYELCIAQTNNAIAPDIDTVFLTTKLEYAYLSSSTVKEIGFYEGDISKFIPGEIIDVVRDKIRAYKENNK